MAYELQIFQDFLAFGMDLVYFDLNLFHEPEAC